MAKKATTATDEYVSALGAASRLLTQWQGEGKTLDNEALLAELEAAYPDQFSEEQWTAGISNAKNVLRKQGILPKTGRGKKTRKPRSKPAAAARTATRNGSEPTLSDLMAV